jgi:hypothetical protein
VVIAGGGATIQAKLGGPGGTNFTKRTNSLNNREVVAQDIVDASGGTTIITLSLNGAESIDGMIFEFAPGSLGSFVAGANEGGAGGNSATNHDTGSAYTGTITTAGPTVLFMMFTAGESNGTPAPSLQFWGVNPLGKAYWNGFNNPDPNASTYWSLIAVSDQASAGTFQGQSSRVSGDLEHQSVIWAYTDNEPSTPTYTNPYANYIAAENSHPGTLNEVWYGGSTNANIAGYSDAPSYNVGDTVNFMVDSFNNSFNVEIARFGYYGYVLFGGRSITTVVGTPAVQPAPTIDGYGGTVCNWTTTATWTIPADAAPGIYIYNMRRTDNAAYIAQGIFVIKNTTPLARDTSRMMVVTADHSWHAYNAWGATSDWGASIASYSGRSLLGQAPGMGASTRTFAISYNRPMGTVGHDPQAYFWDSEVSLINFLEGNGYPVDYYTMADLEKDPTIPSKYGLAVISGHSQYWSTNLRDAFENARDSGTNLAIFSADTSLWHTRFDPADTNKRRMICYKDSLDVAGWDGATKYDPVSYTGTWRDSRIVPGGVNNTARRPESDMTGLWFIANGQFESTLAIPNSYRSLPIWRNTRFASSASISSNGADTVFLATGGTSIIVTQPAGTVVGDLLIIALTFSGQTGTFSLNGANLLRTIDDGVSQTTYLLGVYALADGAQALNYSWANTVLASATIVAYHNAILSDSNGSIGVDTGGTASHTTDSITPASNDRWAVCIFADGTTSPGSKTTSWSAGSGLTSRAQVNNSTTSGPWQSLAIMDTAGTVAQAAHQYSATAQFANTHATTALIYITPGQMVNNARTVGYEWDYVKSEEPSTPKNMVRLSDQIFYLRNQAASYNGDSYVSSGLFRYGLVMYKASSGALVFSTGSSRFAQGISRFRKNLTDYNRTVDTGMQQATLNVLRDLGISPTTVLSTTANNDPTPLVDPGAAASAASYGLTLTDPGYKTIFATSVPAQSDVILASDATLGTVFTASSDGQIYGIRWYFPQYLPNRQVVVALYSWTSDASGIELARATAINIQTGWNNILFSSTVSTTANTKYVAAVWSYDRSVYTDNALTSAVVNGPLTAPADNATTHNGKIVNGLGSIGFPSSSGGGRTYMADVLFIGSGTLAFEGWGLPIS